MKKTKAQFDFAAELLASAKEALAHKRGKIALPTRVIEEITAQEVKNIRKAVATSPKDFEKRFGVPARTIEGWEQGKKVDVAGRVLLRVIQKNPKAVQKALGAAA